MGTYMLVIQDVAILMNSLCMRDRMSSKIWNIYLTRIKRIQETWFTRKFLSNNCKRGNLSMSIGSVDYVIISNVTKS